MSNELSDIVEDMCESKTVKHPREKNRPEPLTLDAKPPLSKKERKDLMTDIRADQRILVDLGNTKTHVYEFKTLEIMTDEELKELKLTLECRIDLVKKEMFDLEVKAPYVHPSPSGYSFQSDSSASSKLIKKVSNFHRKYPTLTGILTGLAIGLVILILV